MLDTLGAITGVLGAVVMSVESKYSKFAFPIWIVSSALWIAYALSTDQLPLLNQQIVYFVINVIGLWSWIIVPILRRKTKTYI